ncbi:PH domain-containing protein [Phytomonospora endophytica]|uniref:YokE-like PH domain-containing protein n=1 Tax=Phytomonospora endophytica TaxID=714109 RepID=A0A841FXI6_9ACTN|nr:PH domain-containing protein [Phytomonospora endophytica]MBB6038448.1 hypothetical protein [Phytomonospora endophytica]GIG64377.1 hypothetical protein Pen01_06720 [Phytomonospora endophytica]
MHTDDPRPDTAAAAEELASAPASGLLAALDRHVRDDELVVCLAPGETAAGKGLLALTNERLLFTTPGGVDVIPLDRVTAVAWKGLLVGVVSIAQGANATTVKAVPKTDGQRFAEAARAAIGA